MSTSINNSTLQSAIQGIRKSPLGPSLERVDDYIRRRGQIRHAKNWDSVLAPLPIPDLVKQRTVTDMAKKFGLSTLVETGTYLGDMVSAVHDHFEHVYTIELSEMLFGRAQRRFSSLKNVDVLHGDSGHVLQSVLPKLNTPTLFWLDAHYSAGFTARGNEDSPVLQELHSIFASSLSGYAILIDDAADFGGEAGYPTIDEVRALVAKKTQDYTVEVKYNAIYIFPKS